MSVCTVFECVCERRAQWRHCWRGSSVWPKVINIGARTRRVTGRALLVSSDLRSVDSGPTAFRVGRGFESVLRVRRPLLACRFRAFAVVPLGFSVLRIFFAFSTFFLFARRAGLGSCTPWEVVGPTLSLLWSLPDLPWSTGGLGACGVRPRVCPSCRYSLLVTGGHA